MPTRADDELEIMRLLARLAQAVDDRDADAYRDCLADEVVCLVSDASPNEVWRAVPREAYARRAVESVSAFDWTHHRLCNFVIVVAGERAHGKVDVVAQMQAPTATDTAEAATSTPAMATEWMRSSPPGIDSRPWAMTLWTMFRQLL